MTPQNSPRVSPFLATRLALAIFNLFKSRSFTVIRDGQDHHLLVILKIKIRSSQKCDLEDQNQDRDLENQDHFTFRTQIEVAAINGGGEVSYKC